MSNPGFFLSLYSVYLLFLLFFNAFHLLAGATGQGATRFGIWISGAAGEHRVGGATFGVGV